MLKDRIIEDIAQRMNISKDVVEAVIMQQFKEIGKAMSSETSIEMSGFGVFYLNRVMAEKQLEILEKVVSGEWKAKRQGKEKKDWENDLQILKNQVGKCRK